MIRFLADGFVWTGRSGRFRLLVAILGWIAMFAGQIALRASGNDFGTTSTIVWIVLAVWTYVTIGHLVRRMHDLGLSGGWAVLAVVPFLGPVFLALALLVPSRDRLYPPAGPVPNLLGIGLSGLICLLILSRIFWEPYLVTTASMKPSLLPGDYVIVTPSRGAFGRGEVAVFHDVARAVEKVGRIVGLPGETVQMKGGLAVVDGVALEQTAEGIFSEKFERQGPLQAFPRCRNLGVGIGAQCLKDMYAETQTDGRSYFVLDTGDTPLDQTPEFRVPEGAYFLLGDNRDNSADSRVSSAALGMGFVSASQISGRVRRVLIGARGQSLVLPWQWRRDRFLVGVQ